MKIISIVYQVNSTTSGSVKPTGTSQASGSQANGATAGSSGGFMQTLAQSLSGETGGASGASNATGLTATPLTFTFASEQDGKQTSVIEELNSLFSDLDKLDTALENDPSLLAGLQALIQQVYTLLNDPSGTENQTTDESQNPAVSLSQHPGAVKFVLQDMLTQLASGVGQMDSSVAKYATEFKSLLQNLQSQLHGAGIDTKGNKGWTELNSILDKLALAKEQAVQSVSTTPVSASKQDSSLVAIEASKALGQKAEDHSESKVSVQTESGLSSEIDSSKVITAGEMSLRSMGTVVAKPAEPVMQATQFAKEMTQFVVDKLDIIQQKGFSEAMISLRPEHLGKLDVQITLQNGQLVARFMTEHVVAKDMLEQQMMQLRSSLQSQGIQVERIEVTQNSSIGSQMYQDGGRQSGGQSQQQRRSREREEHTDEAITAASIQEELRNWRSEQVEGNELQRDTFSAKA